MPTIISQIETVEKHVTTSEERLDTIERTIRLKSLPESQRQSLKEEEKRLNKKLTHHKQELSSLRKENFKSTLLSLTVVGLLFLGYYFMMR